MSSDHVPVPKASTGDGAYAWVRTGVGLMPGAGGLLQMLVSPPIEKRRVEWMQDINDRLVKLEQEEGVDLGKLAEDDQFVSAVMRASHLAVQNHQKLKIEALRNAVLNVARGQAPEDALLHMFLQLVDSLSETQIQMLEAFRDPKDLSTGALINTALETQLPHLQGKNAIYTVLWDDLVAKRLLTGTADGARGSGAAVARVTKMGEQFCAFISDPQVDR